jgi:hypothetical protein
MPLSSVSAHDALFQCSISPNPASTDVLLRVRGADNLRVTLRDMLGRELMTASHDHLASDAVLRLPIGDYPSGVYVVKCSSGGASQDLILNIVR